MLKSRFVTASSSAVSETEPATNTRRESTSPSSIGLVFLCTVFGAAAQIMMKHGTAHLPGGGLGGILTNLAAVLTNVPLMAGYACYGLNTFLLVLALRKGHLSVLYPIIALTFVWVTILSPRFFPTDHLNGWKVAGVSLIVFGVSLIGKGSRR